METQTLAPNMAANRVYIAQLLAASGKTVDKEKIEEMAALERTAINRLVFEMPEPIKEAAVFDVTEIDKFLENDRADRLTIAIERVEGAISNSLRNVRDYQAYINTQFREIAGKQRELDSITHREGITAKSIVEEILKDPWLTFHEVSFNWISFKTGDVVMRYVNPTLAMDMAVNFGPFLVKLNILENLIRVFSWDSLLRSREYFHPHVGIGGDVCLGNGAGAYTTAIDSRNFAAAISIIKVILHTYNPESPYEQLPKFYWKQQQMLGVLDMTKDTPVYIEQRGERVMLYSDRVEHSLAVYARRWLTDGEVYDHEPDPDDGEIEGLILVRLCHKVSKEKGLRMDDNMYAKSNNGRYVKIDEETIYED